MKRASRKLSVLALIAMTCAATGAVADGVRSAPSHKIHAEYTDQIVVRLKDEPESTQRQMMSISSARALSLSAGAPLQPTRPTGAHSQVVKLPQAMPIAEVQRIADKLAKDPNVLFAEPDRRKYAQRVPNDPLYNRAAGGNQWYLFEPVGGINAQSAWDVTTGSASTVVAVVDTGVVYANVDLVGGRMLQPSFDFIGANNTVDPMSFNYSALGPFATAGDGDGRDNNAGDPGDWINRSDQGTAPFKECATDPADPTKFDTSTWHGTHVTGIIGANGNNGIGIAGINWATRILPVRVLGKCGGYTSDIVDGMRWGAGLAVSGVPANPTPANVLNVSLGGPSPMGCSSLEQTAINEILSTTQVRAIVTSAGNEAELASLNSPGNCNGVINVAATDRSGNQTPYTDFGPAITISAPGGFIGPSPDPGFNAILSLIDAGMTMPTGGEAYAFFSGTSAAAPQVTGTISLMLAANPTLTTTSVRTILTSTARAFPMGSTCNTANCGAGIVNVDGAVRMAASMPGGINSAPPPPPSGGGGGGGGGCTTGSGHFDFALPLLMLAALLGLYRRKHK